MMSRKWQSTVAVCAVIVTLLFIVAEVEARRGGGRGGGGRSFSRSGPASGGSVRSHRAPSGQRESNRGSMQENRGDRQDKISDKRSEQRDNRNDRLDDRQEHRDNVREDRQDFVEDVHDDRRDWYDDRYRRRVGVSITYVSFSSLSCARSTVTVNYVTYYRCGDDWYQRAYNGGDVTYIVVAAPAGY